LTQGVTLTDSRKLTVEYKKVLTQTVQGAAVSNSIISFFRQCVMNVNNSMSLSRIPVFIRSAIEQIGINDGMKNSRGLSRQCDETVMSADEARRCQGFYRGVNDCLDVTDISAFPVLFVRAIYETQSIIDTFQQWGAYIRGLYEEAGSIAETIRQAEYYRTETEIVKAEGTVLRGLLIFVRILTTSFVRDFVLRRFLVAREELVLKSCVTKEVIFESRIS
jgi:hypothetical protein